MQLYVRASSSSSSQPPTWEALVQCADRETTIVLADPLKEGQHDQLRWYLEDYYANSPFQLEKATQAQRDLRECGASLLRMLDLPKLLPDFELPLPFLHIFVESSAEDDQDGTFNRILWETLELPECHSTVARGLVVIRSVRRRTEGTLPPAPPPMDGCFRILLVAARNLANRREPDHRLISRSLVSTIESVSKVRAVELELVRPGTFSALKDALQSRPTGYYNLIHFDVHGDVILSEGKRAPALFFVDGDDPFAGLDNATDGLVAHPVSEISSALASANIQKVSLNACRSANATANLAMAFVQEGIRNVVACSHKFHIDAASKFMASFYHNLLVSDASVPSSAAMARGALRNDSERQARFGDSVELQDWIIPVVYMDSSCHDELKFTASGSTNDQPMATHWQPNAESHHDLVGRDFDILIMETLLLLDSRIMVLGGSPGAGKSFLLKHCEWWWQRTKFVERAFYFDGELEDISIENIYNRLILEPAQSSDELSHILQGTSLSTDEKRSKIDAIAKFLSKGRNLLVFDHHKGDIAEGSRLVFEPDVEDLIAKLQHSGAFLILVFPLPVEALTRKENVLFSEYTLEPLLENDGIKLLKQLGHYGVITPPAQRWIQRLLYLLRFLPGMIANISYLLPEWERTESVDEDLESELRGLFFEILLGQEHLPSNTEQSRLLSAKIAAILDGASKTIQQLIICLAPFTSKIPNDLSPFLAQLVESDCLSLSKDPDDLLSDPKVIENSTTSTADQPADFAPGEKTLSKPILAQFAATLAKFEALGLVQSTEDTNMRTFHPCLKNYLALRLRQNEDVCTEAFKAFVVYQDTQFHKRFGGRGGVSIFDISDAIIGDDSNYLSTVAYPVLELSCVETMLITPHQLTEVICGNSWKTDTVLVNAEVLMPLCLAFTREYPKFKKWQSQLKRMEHEDREMGEAIQGILGSKGPLTAAGRISIWIAHYFAEYGLASELKYALDEADDLYFVMQKHLPSTDKALDHCSFRRRLLGLILRFRELVNAGDLIKTEKFLRTTEAEIELRQNARPTSTELAYELAHCRQIILERVIEKDSPPLEVSNALSKYGEIFDKCLALQTASPLFGPVYVGWVCLADYSAGTPQQIPGYKSGLALAPVEFWQGMGPIQPGRNKLLSTLDRSIEVSNWQSELMAYQQIGRIAMEEERWIDAANTQIKILQFSKDKGLPVEEDEQITATMRYAMCLTELDKPAEAASLLEEVLPRAREGGFHNLENSILGNMWYIKHNKGHGSIPSWQLGLMMIKLMYGPGLTEPLQLLDDDRLGDAFERLQNSLFRVFGEKNDPLVYALSSMLGIPGSDAYDKFIKPQEQGKLDIANQSEAFIECSAYFDTTVEELYRFLIAARELLYKLPGQWLSSFITAEAEIILCAPDDVRTHYNFDFFEGTEWAAKGLRGTRGDRGAYRYESVWDVPMNQELRLIWRKYETLNQPLERFISAARASLATTAPTSPPNPPTHTFQEKTIRLLTTGMLPVVAPEVLRKVLPTTGAEDTDLASEQLHVRAKEHVEAVVLAAFLRVVADASAEGG